MALTTLSTVYTYYGTYNSATPYTAKNNAAKMLIEDMAAASIAGLTYDSKVSPDVTTAAQTFSVTFFTLQGYMLTFSITTSSSTTANMVISILSPEGLSASGNSVSITGVLSYSSQIATAYLVINRYLSLGVYDIYAFATFSGNFIPIGALYLDNKSTIAPDYVVSFGYTNTTYLVDPVAREARYTLTCANSASPLGVDSTTGNCVMVDAICIDYNGILYGTLKNCKNVGTPISANITTYAIGGDIYISVAYGHILLKVT